MLHIQFFCIFLKCVCVCVCLCAVSQVWLFATPCCILPGSSLHGILQARILERVSISYSRVASQLRDVNCVSWVSWTGRWIVYHQRYMGSPLYPFTLILNQIFTTISCWKHSPWCFPSTWLTHTSSHVTKKIIHGYIWWLSCCEFQSAQWFHWWCPNPLHQCLLFFFSIYFSWLQWLWLLCWIIIKCSLVCFPQWKLFGVKECALWNYSSIWGTACDQSFFMKWISEITNK